jgi:hypothetical protein
MDGQDVCFVTFLLLTLPAFLATRNKNRKTLVAPVRLQVFSLPCTVGLKKGMAASPAFLLPWLHPYPLPLLMQGIPLARHTKIFLQVIGERKWVVRWEQIDFEPSTLLVCQAHFWLPETYPCYPKHLC